MAGAVRAMSPDIKGCQLYLIPSDNCCLPTANSKLSVASRKSRVGYLQTEMIISNYKTMNLS